MPQTINLIEPPTLEDDGGTYPIIPLSSLILTASYIYIRTKRTGEHRVSPIGQYRSALQTLLWDI